MKNIKERIMDADIGIRISENSRVKLVPKSEFKPRPFDPYFIMPRWFEEGCEPEECNPVEDLKRCVEEALTYRENLLLVPAEQKEMFEEAAKKARREGIPVPKIEAVWRKEKTE